jgi:hypothetical protein
MRRSHHPNTPPSPKIVRALRNNAPQTPITDHHTCVRSHVASTFATAPPSLSAAASRKHQVPVAPKGQRIPAQGATLGNG